MDGGGGGRAGELSRGAGVVLDHLPVGPPPSHTGVTAHRWVVGRGAGRAGGAVVGGLLLHASSLLENKEKQTFSFATRYGPE